MIPALVGILLLIVVPLGFTLYFSLRDYSLQRATDAFVGFKNYWTILSGGDADFLASLGRTFIYVAVVILADLVFAMAQALLLYSMRPRRAKLWRGVFLLPILIIPTASAIFWRTIMYAPGHGEFLKVLGLDGLIQPPLGDPFLAFCAILITVIWAWSPWVFLQFSSGLDALDKGVIEASMVDGAGYFKRLRHIILPLMRPVIFVTLSFKAVDSFLSFPFVWVLTQGGPGRSTHLLSTYIYHEAFFNLDYGAGSALAIVMLVISGLLSIGTVMVWQRFYGKEF